MDMGALLYISGRVRGPTVRGAERRCHNTCDTCAHSVYRPHLRLDYTPGSGKTEAVKPRQPYKRHPPSCQRLPWRPVWLPLMPCSQHFRPGGIHIIVFQEQICLGSHDGVVAAGIIFTSLSRGALSRRHSRRRAHRRVVCINMVSAMAICGHAAMPILNTESPRLTLRVKRRTFIRGFMFRICDPSRDTSLLIMTTKNTNFL